MEILKEKIDRKKFLKLGLGSALGLSLVSKNALGSVMKGYLRKTDSTLIDIDNIYDLNYYSTNYVPYTGANADVDLGVYDLTCTDLTVTNDLYVYDNIRVYRTDNVSQYFDLREYSGRPYFELNVGALGGAAPMLAVLGDVTGIGTFRLQNGSTGDMAIEFATGSTYFTPSIKSYFGWDVGDNMFSWNAGGGGFLSANRWMELDANHLGLPANNRKLILGSGDVFELYYDGSNSWVKPTSGGLYLNGSSFTAIRAGATENLVAVGSLVRAGSDNSIDLGSSTIAWKDIYAYNMGLEGATPISPLSFGQTTGNKIDLWQDGTNRYGFGIQAGVLQTYVPNSSSDFVWGYGKSSPFTEVARLTGDGDWSVDGSGTFGDEIVCGGTASGMSLIASGLTVNNASGGTANDDFIAKTLNNATAFVVDASADLVDINTNTTIDAASGVGLIVTGGAGGADMAQYIRNVSGFDYKIMYSANSTEPQVSYQRHTSTPWSNGVRSADNSFSVAYGSTLTTGLEYFNISPAGLALFSNGTDFVTFHDGNYGIVINTSGSGLPSLSASGDIYSDSVMAAPIIAGNEYYDAGGAAQWGQTDGSGNFQFYGNVDLNGFYLYDSANINMNLGNGVVYIDQSSFAMNFAQSGTYLYWNDDGVGNNDAWITASSGIMTIGTNGTGNTAITIGSSQEVLFHNKIYFTQTDGNEYIDSLADGYLDIGATTAIRLKNIALMENAVHFTQTDGNEFIDSLNDGYMDYGATTEHRFNNAISMLERSSDPTDPIEGRFVLWKSDGTGTGDDGDILYKEQSASTVTQGSLKWKDFTPSTVTLNAGTSTSTVSDVQTMFDGNTYDIAEVAATPGFDVEFNFTGIDRNPRFVVCRWMYDGSATHFVTIDIYNYNTTSWDQVRVFSNSNAYYDSMTMMLPINVNGDYVDGSGNAKIRFYHQTSGNAAHDIHIDYVGLSHSLQGVL